MDQITVIKLGIAAFTVGLFTAILAATGYISGLLAEPVFYAGFACMFCSLAVTAIACEEEYLWRNGRRVPVWKC